MGGGDAISIDTIGTILSHRNYSSYASDLFPAFLRWRQMREKLV
jgi:hypothetical protein